MTLTEFHLTEEKLEEGVLSRFIVPQDALSLEGPEEEKTFQELQQYNLVRLTSKGRIEITRRGEYALNVGVRKYLLTRRFEERLIQDSFRNRGQHRWMIPILVLVAVSLVVLLYLLYIAS